MKTNIALFASGNGSNAQKIMAYFKDSNLVHVALLVGNKKEMGAYEKAEEMGVPHLCVNKADFYESNQIVALLRSKEVDFIVLAGFLWLIPAALIQAFPNRIVNIHPALLPNYGGKGMYGHFVHEAVFQAHEKKSGMTIHYVNEKFDEGEIIFQAECELDENDTPATIATKVLSLEHQHYAPVVEKLIKNLQKQS